MKYYIIAGEASGDLHGSHLIQQILQIDTTANIRCWGGHLMEQAGGVLVKNYKTLAFMGFAEVIKNLPTIIKNIQFCKKDVTNFAPDVLVLIDYPGFNLRIAKWAHTQGIKVLYYISPQIWAWKASRVHAIKRDVDKMLVILPFEKSFYQQYQYDVTYVGHPLAHIIADYKSKHAHIPKQNVIALLPGSRQQEILVKLPIMLSVAAHFTQYSFVVAKAPGVDDALYQQLLKPYKNVQTVANNTYMLLTQAKAALVTSGTATLEAALFNVPQVIVYKGSSLSYQIAKRLIKIKYIGLANLIMDKPMVKELIQHELTQANLIAELSILLKNGNDAESQLQQDYNALSHLLSQAGHASTNAAIQVCKLASA